MPTLTITKNYDDGAGLTESMLDDIKTSVETWANTTKLDSTNIQTGGIATANLATGAVDTAALGTSAVTSAKIESSVNLPGSGVQVNSKRVITCNTNASANLSVIRAAVNAAGSLVLGEGLGSTSTPSTGVYSISYSAAFADTPVITVTPSAFCIPYISSVSSSACEITFKNTAGTLVATDFHFIVIGKRA